MSKTMTRRKFLLALTAASFSVASTSFGVRSGVLPSKNELIIQEERRKAEREALRRSTWEGIFYDRRGRPLTIPTAPGLPSGVVDISVGNLIGYRTSNGSSGLRKQYEEQLCYSTRPGGGKGTEIHLTIDLDLQRKAYKLVKGTKGCVIVYNCCNGNLLAAASSRGEVEYDVNAYSERFSEYKNIPEFFYDPLYKKAAPGSTMKLITTYGLLYNNIIGLDELNAPVFCDTGEYHGVHNASPHSGPTSLSTAVEKSLNTFFAWGAEQIGIDNFLDTCSRFGFEDDDPMCPIEVDGHALGATLGLTKDSPVGDLHQSGFGQGKISVTPFNIVLWYATLAAGPDSWLWMPHTVDHFHDPESDAPDSRPELDNPNPLPRNFFDSGAGLLEPLCTLFSKTAKRYGLSHPDVTGIYAKSGTAQTSVKGSNTIYLAFSFNTRSGGAYSALISQSEVNGTSSLLYGKAKQLLDDIMEVLS